MRLDWDAVGYAQQDTVVGVVGRVYWYIALVATGAAAANCILERQRDALMVRTHLRPLPQGHLSWQWAAVYALFCTSLGLIMLGLFVNTLTMYLTLATFFAYSVVYTHWLKPLTPQNIVIGGAAGAMPPVLGWAAMTNSVSPEAAVLFLIIYAWTPPHFWALALYRLDDYRRAGLPMLPVTHGRAFTQLAIWLYSHGFWRQPPYCHWLWDFLLVYMHWPRFG
ncbi:heme o synthase [Deefgea sp. CFH1-16]|uniref:heme o synthase n=1 Tax=Deefgea sp. CFH1-16 TaxID=2675457 RepID=UPI001FFCDE42|nr:heme o synthase [Deefgea sp. CFH1-16]